MAGSHYGVLKSFNPQKGFGFIECAETFSIFNKDVFVMRSALPMNICTGDEVQFSYKEKPGSGPVAIKIQLAPGTGRSLGLGLPAAYRPVNIHESQVLCMASYRREPMQSVSSSSQPSAQSFYGKVITFNEAQGWGHISCDATRAMYGKDVYLRRAVLSDQSIQSGDLVSFKVELAPKGPQATCVLVLPPGAIGFDGKPGFSFSGVITRWNDEKGYGFLQGEDLKEIFSKDIFVSKRELGGITPTNGDTVQFCVELDKSGMPRAIDVTFCGHGSLRSTATSQAARASPY